MFSLFFGVVVLEQDHPLVHISDRPQSTELTSKSSIHFLEPDSITRAGSQLLVWYSCVSEQQAVRLFHLK